MSQSVSREQGLTDRIQAVERELDSLYRERAGSLIESYPGLGWCCICGRNQVEYGEGFDSCETCVPRRH